MFLADENVPPKVIEFLRSKGYKVKDAREDNLQGISDNELIHMAEKEGFTLITFDKHFGNILLYPPKEYHGIIRISIHPPILEDIFSAFDKFFKSFDLSKLSGVLVILEKKDEEFNNWSREMAKSQAEKGQSIIYIKIKKMRPIRSRIEKLEIAL